MGKHVHNKMTKYTKTHQRSESELTRSLRAINISRFCLSAPKTEGASHKPLTRCTRNTQIYVFSRGGFMEPPAPTIYIYTQTHTYIYIYMNIIRIYNYVHIYIYICIYIYRERENTKRERVQNAHIYIYIIYIYTYVNITSM